MTTPMPNGEICALNVLFVFVLAILSCQVPAASAAAEGAAGNEGWFAFDPKPDNFATGSGLDLRPLNEKFAGEGGFIVVKDGHFIHSRTGKAVRFWAVNGPPGELKEMDQLRKCAQMLAKHGVNLVRVHGGYFDENGNVREDAVQHAIDIVQAMKSEGIYTHFSTYFPLWLRPKPGTPWLDGYDGSKNPFAALYFNPDFQMQYRTWWKALLTTPGKMEGKRLIDEPAVCSVELVNEDSFFFWTFATENIPDRQLRILEKQFADWLVHKYGSLDAAMRAWKGLKADRDNFAEGRVGFRPWWNMFNDKTPRDRDTAAFLLESQRNFYQRTIDYLRGLGFKGLITCSNWTTASAEVLGPLEKYSYMVGDFIDRHGYFDCHSAGDNSGWSIRPGHTYIDRSALRFEGDEPGKPKLFVNPVIDIKYGGKPSMISETTFNRPNRYRSEAPLYFACYGALQDSDAIVHFALDEAHWSVKPGYFMQPWTLMSPAMMGQFPAAALVFRKGLVAPGEVLVDLDLKVQDLVDLKGTPLPQDAAFDELRLKDVPQGTQLKPGNVIDPLVHFAGRTSVRFSAQGGPPRLRDLHPYVHRAEQTVVSTTGQLKLDYGNGVLIINAPAAQGVSGNLKAAGTTKLRDITVASPLDLGAVIAVSLDDKPLATSRQILLQVMSEEKASGFTTEPAGNSIQRITDIGHDPWLVKELTGTVKLNRADASQMKVNALDLNGFPAQPVGDAADIKLLPNVVYYLITR